MVGRIVVNTCGSLRLDRASVLSYENSYEIVRDHKFAGNLVVEIFRRVVGTLASLSRRENLSKEKNVEIFTKPPFFLRLS